jgi:hypothetical protein
MCASQSCQDTPALAAKTDDATQQLLGRLTRNLARLAGQAAVLEGALHSAHRTLAVASSVEL